MEPEAGNLLFISVFCYTFDEYTNHMVTMYVTICLYLSLTHTRREEKRSSTCFLCWEYLEAPSAYSKINICIIYNIFKKINNLY